MWNIILHESLSVKDTLFPTLKEVKALKCTSFVVFLYNALMNIYITLIGFNILPGIKFIQVI